MIDLDSPVESVLGVPRARRHRRATSGITERLGIETVGDLLHHFPRRYLETGSLLGAGDLEEGQLLTVVGEISSSQARPTRTGAPAARPTARRSCSAPRARRCG